MSTCMRTLILGAAIGIAAAVTTTSATHAGVIGPGMLHITEPASLAEPVRARMVRVDSRSLNVKAAQVPGRSVVYSATVEKSYTVRRGDTLSSVAVPRKSTVSRRSTGIKETVHLPIYDAINIRAKPKAR